MTNTARRIEPPATAVVPSEKTAPSTSTSSQPAHATPLDILNEYPRPHHAFRRSPTCRCPSGLLYHVARSCPARSHGHGPLCRQVQHYCSPKERRACRGDLRGVYCQVGFILGYYTTKLGLNVVKLFGRMGPACNHEITAITPTSDVTSANRPRKDQLLIQIHGQIREGV